MTLMQVRTSRQRVKCALHAFIHRVTRPKTERVAVFPTVSDNPYFSLMYSEWRSATYSVDPQTVLRLQRMGLIDVLHLHWDEYFLPVRDAAQRDLNLTAVTDFKNRGGRVVWTMHNAQPHVIEDAELKMFHDNRRALVQLCDAIHVHSKTAGKLLCELYGVAPEMIEVVPHPSYSDVFEQPSSKAFSDKKSFLVFGIMHASKGVDFICDGFNAVDTQDQLEIVHFAGRGAQELAGHFTADFPIKLTDGFIDDGDMSKLFGAADFCVFGFKSTLTSGSLLLAISMGTPPIFPDFPSLSEGMPDRLRAYAYPPGDLDGLQCALERAMNTDAHEYQALCRDCDKFAQTLAPQKLSKKLEALVLGLSSKL